VWYLTGWLDDAARDVAKDAVLGFQVTFFRIHTAIDPANPSRFAAHQCCWRMRAARSGARRADPRASASAAPDSALPPPPKAILT